MNLSRCKIKTLVDIYYLYPNKKNITHKLGTIPYPFIKQTECTDNKLSVDWKEWNTIVQLYISKLKVYLEEGNSIELGSKLGDFFLTKRKCDRFIDFKKSKEAGKKIAFRHNNTDNYYIYHSWPRKKVMLKLQSFWKISLNQRWLRSMYLACEKDYTKIYKIRDANESFY